MIIPSSDEIMTTIQRYFMIATGEYETVKPTPSIMDNPYAQVLE